MSELKRALETIMSPGFGQSVSPPRLAPPGQVFVPVTARGEFVFDNGGDAICQCFTAELAGKVAALINLDAASPTPKDPTP